MSYEILYKTQGWGYLHTKQGCSTIEVSGKGDPEMRSQTGKKLILEAGLNYGTQEERYYHFNNGKVYFLGERKHNKDRAFFKVIGGNTDGILETLEKFLQSKGYETEINQRTYGDALQVLNPNKKEEK